MIYDKFLIKGMSKQRADLWNFIKTNKIIFKYNMKSTIFGGQIFGGQIFCTQIFGS